MRKKKGPPRKGRKRGGREWSEGALRMPEALPIRPRGGVPQAYAVILLFGR